MGPTVAARVPSARSWPKASLLIVFVFLYIGVLLATFVTSAYRLPLHIPLILFAGLTLSRLLDWIKKENYDKLLFLLVIVALLAWPIHHKTYLSNENYEQRMKLRLEFLAKSKGAETEKLYAVLTR